MTVAIAAICEHGRGVITASDRMLSRPDIMIPNATPKVARIGPKCLLLWAGESGHEIDIIRMCRSDDALMIREHFDRVLEATDVVRDRLVRERVLRPRRIPEDIVPMTDSNLSSEMQRELMRQINSVSVGLDFIVAGVDTDGSHIYALEHDDARCYDSGGYKSIGSGWYYAESSLARWGFNRSYGIHPALFLVYEAKRRAEAAPTVGREIDLWAVGPERALTIPEKWIETFKEVYDERVLSAETGMMAGVLEEFGAEGQLGKLFGDFGETATSDDPSSEPEPPSGQSPDDEPPTVS